MRKRYGLAGLVGAALLALSPAAVSAQAKDKIAVAMSNRVGFLYLAPLIAKELGYFDQENIDAEMVSAGGGSKALAALVGGNVQFYTGAPTSSFRAKSKGADVIVIGANVNQFATNLVISGAWAKKHGITAASSYQDKLKAMRGITFAVASAGSGGDTLVRAIASEAGLDPSRDMTITAVGTGDAMTAALIQGRVDGFAHSSPVGENAIKQHGAVMYLNMAQGEVKSLDGFFYIGQIAQTEWLKQNEELAVRYLRAIQKALDAIHDPDESIKARDAVHAAYNPKLDKDLFDGIWKDTVPSYAKSLRITDQMISTVVEFSNRFEKEPLDPEIVAQAWTNRYAEAAANGTAGR